MTAITLMFLYNILTNLYFLFIKISSIFNPKAKLWVEGRRSILNHMANVLPENEKRIWIHCASLGEFEQGRPVIEKLKLLYPEIKILLTFFSLLLLVLKLGKNYPHADYIFFTFLRILKRMQ